MNGLGPVRTECWDCTARVGQKHERGCDAARCLWTGFQRLACSAFGHAVDYVNGVPVAVKVEEGHDCGHDVWTGWWPGKLEAAALGLWCRETPPRTPCDPDLPDAIPDVNRLLTECRWDRDRRQWLRGTA